MARYPGLEDDIRAALEGLELVHGLLGLGSATGSGSGRRGGLDHRIESGRRIAGYRVVRELGRGGMGTVYEAVHVGLDRPVALKVLGVHAAPDSSARRRFLNEARTAAGLHHTHIVPVFDVGQVGGLCYYAMQRIEGSGLDRVLKHLRRTRQVASGGRRGPFQLAAAELPGTAVARRLSRNVRAPSRLLGPADREPGCRRATRPMASIEQAQDGTGLHDRARRSEASCPTDRRHRGRFREPMGRPLPGERLRADRRGCQLPRRRRSRSPRGRFRI